MSFDMKILITQVLYTALIIEIKKYQAILKKAEGIIKNSVVHKH